MLEYSSSGRSFRGPATEGALRSIEGSYSGKVKDLRLMRRSDRETARSESRQFFRDLRISL